MNNAILRRVAKLENEYQINNNGELSRELTEGERRNVKFFKEIHSIRTGNDEQIFNSEQYQSWNKTLNAALEERNEILSRHNAEGVS